MTTQHDERAELIRRVEELTKRFSEGWHDGIKIDATDIATLSEAGALLAADAQGGEPIGTVVEYWDDELNDEDIGAEWIGTPPATGTKLYTHPHPQAVAQGWIPVEQQMPKSGQIVLALQKWDHSGRMGVIRAAWVAAKTEESSPESDIGEYDEATDTYYDPEGWYEQISHWDEISAAGVSGATIVAWMPLPNVLSVSPAAPAAAQVAQPLTDEQIGRMYRETQLGDGYIVLRSDYERGIRDAEAAHGIGKDQA